mmetsp:Transcript_16279/g.33006  ORF Transcript_16279/g.33006 Transcript_16279/m.33006 type:complete len:224 (+) Transcript_16279:737-1408(+)
MGLTAVQRRLLPHNKLPSETIIGRNHVPLIFHNFKSLTICQAKNPHSICNHQTHTSRHPRCTMNVNRIVLPPFDAKFFIHLIAPPSLILQTRHFKLLHRLIDQGTAHKLSNGNEVWHKTRSDGVEDVYVHVLDTRQGGGSDSSASRHDVGDFVRTDPGLINRRVIRPEENSRKDFLCDLSIEGWVRGDVEGHLGYGWRYLSSHAVFPLPVDVGALLCGRGDSS